MYRSEPPAVAEQDQASRLRRIGSAFSIPSWWYCLRGVYLLTFTYRCSALTQISFFAGNLGDRHLEIPAGDGTLLTLQLLLRRIQRRPRPTLICAADISQGMLASARRRFAGEEGIEVAYGNVGDLAHPSACFTTINVANGFHCFPEPLAAVHELYRVLRPGGTLAVNVLLHPRSWWIPRRIAAGINRRAIASGALNGTFEETEAVDLFTGRGFVVVQRCVHGNTLHLVVRKPTEETGS